ncbi:MAG TPA: hypothetical protein VE987_11880 [Polyangiaceae bacterium]|nr:hypothetical protein [Polyangiaceae bacterium]
MASQFVEAQPPRDRHERTVEIVGAGSMVEALGAATAVVLAILGLAGALPGYMMSIATIVLGAAILFQGGTIAARYHRLISQNVRPGGAYSGAPELTGGMTAESIAGIAGIALGILSLLGVLPVTLCAIAVIAFGAAEVLGSAAASRFNSVSVESEGLNETARGLLRETAKLSLGGQVLVGVAAIVLGILALLGVQPLTLTLVGLLGVACSVLLGGSALGARMLGIMRHSHP